ncbi:MAG: hypothetical protein LW605_03360 [Xanthomonadales bacterium]|nr:hypothetical protein [Xanthomonadales bacterium]
MDTLAVVLEGPERLALARLSLCEPAPEDVVVDIEWSGISTGTERLLWSGAACSAARRHVSWCPLRA